MIHFYLLALANFFFFLANSFFHLFPIYMGQIGASTTYIGLIMGLTSGMSVILTWTFRNRIDFVNKRKFLFYSSVCCMLVYLGYYLRADLYSIPFWRLLQGVFYSISFTFGAAYAVDLIPPSRRAGLIGLFGISGALTNAVGPFMAERLLMHYPFAILFLAAAFSMLIAAGCLFAIRSVPPARDKNTTQPAHLKEYRKIIPLPLLLGMIFATFFSFISHYARESGLNEVAWFYLGYTFILMIVRVLFNGRFSTWKYQITIPTTFYIGIVGLVLASGLSAYPVVPMLVAIGMMLGIAHGILYPTLTVVFLEATPHRSGKATLIFILCFNLGGMLASFINGFIADLTGYQYMYLIAAAVVFLLFMGLYDSVEVRRLSGQRIAPAKLEQIDLDVKS